MKNKLLSALLLIFSVLFLYYPASYGITDIKPIISFVIVISMLAIIVKKFNLKLNNIEKYYIFIILLLAILTRIGIVFLLNNKVIQISDFEMALDVAKTGWFQTEYYQVFTHWIIYPKILSHMFKIFGTSQLIALLTNGVVLVLTSLLIYKNAITIFKNKTLGFISSLLYILWPANILYTLIITPEHFCTFTLMLVLLLFLNLQEKGYENNRKLYLVVISLLIGVLLSISSFFKNFAPVFIIAFIIYYFMDFLKNYEYKKDLKKAFSFNKTHFKILSVFIIMITFLSSNNIIFNKIEKDIVKAKVVRNVAPCYLNVGLRDSGVYSPENYQMYFDTLKKYNYDYKKANREILKNLKYYLKEEVNKEELKKLLDSKSKIIFGNDESKLNFLSLSIQNDNILAESINTDIKEINNKYFTIIVFLAIIGLIASNKEKNLKLFLSYLIFFGGLLLILIIEGQNRYMYAIQPLLCIGAVSGINIISKLLKNHINA